MKIRDMRPDDWEAVAAIYQEGIDTRIATFQTDIPDYEEFDHSHMAECRLVIEEEGKVIAWAALTPYSSRCVYAGVASVSIYVKGDSRGRKVGEQLLMAVIKESERIGLWTLQSSIIEINSRSLALHDKCGFRVVGVREKIAQDYYGNWQNVVLTERRSSVVGVV